METQLNKLFDFQRFQQKARLSSSLSDVGSRYGNGLNDDDIYLVNVAGENLPIGVVIPDLELEPEGYMHDDKHTEELVSAVFIKVVQQLIDCGVLEVSSGSQGFSWRSWTRCWRVVSASQPSTPTAAGDGSVPGSAGGAASIPSST